MNKTLLKIALLIMLVSTVAAGLYLFNLKRQADNGSAENGAVEQEKKPFIEQKPLINSELPKGFPRNLPTESGVRILQNYEVTVADGRFQSTRVTTTEKGLIQAVQAYVSFFENLGWEEIPGQVKNDSTEVALLKNGADSLLIVATENNNEKTISLTLTQSATAE